MEEYEILSQKIVISNPEEIEMARYAIEIVNDKINEIIAEKPMLGPQKVAVLALLQIAGSMAKDRRAIDEYRKQLDQRCSDLMTEVSHVMSENLATHQSSV